jgi:hypothetical protein
MNKRKSAAKMVCLALTLAAFNVANSASAQTLLADFQFNEGSGSTTSSSTNGLVGNLGVQVDPANLPTSTTDTPSGAPGDRAVQFVNDSFLVVDDSQSPILALRTDAMTLEAWVKHDSGSTRQYEGIMAYGNAYKLGLNNSELIFTLFGVVDVSSGWYLNPDTWHHVAAAWEPGVGVTFYLDGQPTFTPAEGAMNPFANNLFNIGAERLNVTFQGTIDRVRVHGGLLTAEQLDSVPNSPKTPMQNTLVSYNFNETAMPYQNAAGTPRPTMIGAEYASQLTAPTFTNDTPSRRSNDYALEFTRAGQRVLVPDPNEAVRFDTGDFTVQAWVKFGPQTARSVLLFHNAPGGAFSFSILNRRVFVTTLGIVDQPSNAEIPDDGGWHHIAVVHEAGKEFRFYVDGILGDTVPYDRGVLIDVRTNDTFYIGSEPTGGLPFVGKLDRLSVTRGVVPAEELDFQPIPGVEPGAPELSIQTVVEISWPSLPAGYKLQSTTNVADPASWTPVSDTPFAVEGVYKFYVPVAAQQRFYRLIKE